MISSKHQNGSTDMPFDLRTATASDLLARADYLETFPATAGYRRHLDAEAAALRALAKNGNPYWEGPLPSAERSE